MVNYKRRRYIVKRGFQLKYTFIILIFILLTAVISTAIVYLAVFPFLSAKLASVYPQARLVAVLKDAHSKVLVSTALILPIAAWIGIMLSHRIAGPWYRLEKILRDVAKGKLTAEVKLRKGDELQTLADAINEVIGSLRSVSQQNLTGMKLLEENLQIHSLLRTSEASAFFLLLSLLPLSPQIVQKDP